MPTPLTTADINKTIAGANAMLAQTKLQGDTPYAGSTFKKDVTGILSTENGADKAKKLTELNDKNIAIRNAPAPTLPKIETPKVEAPTATFVDANGAEILNPTYEQVRDNKLTFASGEMPSWYNKDPKARALEADIAKANSDAEAKIAEIDALKKTYGEMFANQLENIKKTFEKRKAQMADVNERRVAQLRTSGIRSGSERYAESFGGVITEEEKQGINRLAELDQQQAEAESLAKQAQMKQDWEMFDRQMAIQDKITERKTKELETLNEAAIAETKAREEARVKEEAEFNKTITNLLTEAAKGGATPDIIDAISGSQSISEAIKNAGESLQNTITTGPVGEYLFYSKDAQKRGIEPLSFDEYQTRDMNRKARVAAAASNPDRLLTVTETQALGMPFGTTASEAYGKTATKPPTDAQSRDALYGQRTLEAGQTIDELETYATTVNPLVFSSASMAENTTLGNVFIPDEIRQLRQAQRNFYNAVLRRESGAVISPTEFSEAIKQYFPRPGDDEKTLAQKRSNRQTAITRMIKSAGPAFSAEMSVPSLAAEQEILSKNDPLGIGTGKTSSNPLGI